MDEFPSLTRIRAGWSAAGISDTVAARIHSVRTEAVAEGRKGDLI